MLHANILKKETVDRRPRATAYVRHISDLAGVAGTAVNA